MTHPHYKLLMTLVLTILTTCASANALAQSPAYTVTVTDRQSNQIRIQATLKVNNQTLSMADRGPAPEQWGQFVRNLRVIDTQNQAIPTRKDSGSQWHVDADRGAWVTVTYDIDLSHEDISWPGGIDGVAFQRNNGIYATGRSLFIMSDATQGPISVAIEHPDTWSAHTPWEEKDAPSSYWVDNNNELSESILMVGQVTGFALDAEGLNLEFVLAGEGIQRQQPVFKARAEQLLSYYTQLMGGLPVSGSAQENDKMLVIINQHQQTDGEVIGRHISMLMNPDASAEEQLITWFLYAHEFFHLWNGRSIMVESPRADWFKEGITNYYTFKGLLETGIIPKQGAFMVINHLLYQRYLNDPGLGSVSPSKAATSDKDGHWGLVYGGGFFAGLAIDLAIREHTDNTQSLDTIMRQLYQEYALKGQYYTSADIQQLVDRTGTRAHHSVIKNSVLGTDTIDIVPILTDFGFAASITDGQLQLSENNQATAKQRALRQGFYGKQ